ncbi:MAG: DNA methylase [Chloroflexi bacterium]|nr:DNA methylase [Chloroflexota bacterium]
MRRQSARRHYGVHPYFTRQVWNVVQEYIKNYSQPGDLILDPFGGSGVTAIEAIVLGRRAIHIDINPLTIFWVNALAQPLDLNEFGQAYDRVVAGFKRLVPKSEAEIQAALGKYPYPSGHPLPKNSDVDTIEQLFSDRQLAELALLKHLIISRSDGTIRDNLLLMFSGLLNKINLTFHQTPSPGGGDSAMRRYFRHRIAPNPTVLDTIHFFGVRYRRIVSAKKELAPHFTPETIHNFQAYQGTATNLKRIADESVDYVYTDPPYGAKIQYLDLSTMWLAWLDLPVSDFDRQQEIIEGGRLAKTREEYSDLMAQSIRELYRVLKYDRWMSFVFADKNPAYWHTIVETAEKAGFEYMGAVPQSNSTRSFKKVQHPSSVLSGQLIINFRKVRSPRAIMKLDLGDDATDLILETAENVIAEENGATIEDINSELIIKGIELGFLDLLSKKYDDLSPLLDAYFDLDGETQKYHLPANKKFKSAIPVALRLRYFLLSYLKRKRQQKFDPDFSEIVQNIMPMLKNGITPEEQTILNVLKDLAWKMPSGRWRLRLRDSDQPRFDGF